MPPQTTIPPLPTALSASGTNSPAGAKMMAASSGTGGCVSETPHRAQGFCKFLPGRIPTPCKGVNLPSLVAGHLGDDMGRSAETVDPHAPGGTGLHQASVTNQIGRASCRERV